MPFIQQLAETMATQGAGGLLGIGLGAINDQRQYNQQQKLQKLQIAGSKELTDYNYQKQLDMWHATNYWAIVKELEKANLNPALLYGMSGGGGTTTGSGSGAQVQGANAPVGGREVQDIMGMGMQLQLLKSQQRVLETQADKNEAEANKTKGVDTTEAQTRIASLTQGIENQKAQQALTEVQTRLNKLDEKIKGDTLQEQIDQIVWSSQISLSTLDAINRENIVAKATMNDRIDTVKAEYIAALLRNTLTTEITKLTKEQTELTKHQWNLTEAQIREIANNILLRWDSLADDQKNTLIKSELKDHMTEMPESVKAILGVISQAVDGIMRKGGTNTRQPIGFK